MRDDRPDDGPVGDPSRDRSGDEDAWIARVAARYAKGDRVEVGIGHDAAVVRLDGRRVVVKTDVLVDGVHFRLAECGPTAAARKAIAVNVSDLAAMAAIPRAVVVGAVLPRGVTFDLFDGLAKGLDAAAREMGVNVVGGDTNVADGPLVLAVAAFGEPGPEGVVTRSGARPGDALSVTGALGGSLLGRHLTFTPRVREARVLAARRIPHAMMDLSDGLSMDLPRLCAMSRVGADLVAEWIPVHADAHVASDAMRGREGDVIRPSHAPHRSPLEHALDDGEDFELLLAHAPLSDGDVASLANERVTLIRVGTVTADGGVVRLIENGVARPLPRRGYDHLRSP